MDAVQPLASVSGRSGKAWKGLRFGALGVGLACLGCCLAPILGTLLAAGAGAGLAGFFRSWAVLAGLGGMAVVMAFFAVLKARRSACCPHPGAECGTGRCGIPAKAGKPRIEMPESSAALPSCRLSPEAQASRIGQLRAGLFQEIDAIFEEEGRLRFRFTDKPEIVKGVADFIRFVRECCTSLRFGLEWEPKGGPVTLEMKGPAPLLKALKEAAGPESRSL